MFTGLVEATGVLAARTRVSSGARVLVETSMGPLVLGESISTDGVCLTVDGLPRGGFHATLSHETLARTTLGDRPIGARVNLERALAVGDRLGGHFVTGHVDGVGRVERVEEAGPGVIVTLSFPPELARFFAEKGSITVSGVSLTVNAVAGATLSFVLVPHTRASTALPTEPGARVNLEVDVLARYVARALEVGRGPGEDGRGDAAWLARLGQAGYL